MAIECDVLVVGAGPAGLSAALLLSKQGFNPIIVEKNSHGGPDHPKYDITEGNRINEILDELGIKPYKISNQSEWYSPNNRFLLHSEIQDYYFKRGPDEDSLENKLTKTLQNRGVNILFNSMIQTLKFKAKHIDTIKITIKKEKKEMKPEFIVVAEGPESNIRKKMHLTVKKLAVFQGYGVVVKTQEKNVIPHARIYFDENIAPGGYVYSGSVEHDTFFCVVTDKLCSKNISLKKKLANFLKKKIDWEFTSKNYFSGFGVSGVQQTIGRNVFFIGGAAGFYDPFLGYGLNYAIESAQAATEAIVKGDLQTYKEYSNGVQNNFKNMLMARKIWRKADNEFYDKLINAFNGQYAGKDNKINSILTIFSEE
jgi:flavin-dependent dehydrogenase